MGGHHRRGEAVAALRHPHGVAARQAVSRRPSLFTLLPGKKRSDVGRPPALALAGVIAGAGGGSGGRGRWLGVVAAARGGDRSVPVAGRGGGLVRTVGGDLVGAAGGVGPGLERRGAPPRAGGRPRGGAAGPWNGGASARWPWSSPWPAAQARHSPCLAAPDASEPVVWSLALPAAASAAPPPSRPRTKVAASPWAEALAAEALDDARVARSADAGERPVAAAATPPSESAASPARMAVLTRGSLLGTACPPGVDGATQGTDRWRS